MGCHSRSYACEGRWANTFGNIVPNKYQSLKLILTTFWQKYSIVLYDMHDNSHNQSIIMFYLNFLNKWSILYRLLLWTPVLLTFHLFFIPLFQFLVCFAFVVFLCVTVPLDYDFEVHAPTYFSIRSLLPPWLSPRYTWWQSDVSVVTELLFSSQQRGVTPRHNYTSNCTIFMENTFL